MGAKYLQNKICFQIDSITHERKGLEEDINFELNYELI